MRDARLLRLAARLPAAFRERAEAATDRLAPPVQDGADDPVLAMLATAILGCLTPTRTTFGAGG